MKKIIIYLMLAAVLCTNFQVVAQADCRSDYEKEIAARLIKLGKFNRVAQYTTGTAVGGTSIFMGVMGVLLVGPWGILIGLQFGALASLVGVPLWVVSKIKKAQLNKFGSALQLLDEVSTSGSSASVLNGIWERLRKRHSDLTLDQVKGRIQNLNNNRALCDGTVSQYKKLAISHRLLATPQQIAKYLEHNF